LFGDIAGLGAIKKMADPNLNDHARRYGYLPTFKWVYYFFDRALNRFSLALAKKYFRTGNNPFGSKSSYN
jgi:hypothetical protein